MFQELPLPLHWPVNVTQLEAEAYARWAGKSVATEEQFHRAAYGGNIGEHREIRGVTWHRSLNGAISISNVGTQSRLIERARKRARSVSGSW